MSYVINNTRGQIVAVVPDGTINTSATPVTLVGRGVTSYGAYENENYVWILENFANSSAPANPIVGQLWYNTDTDTMSIWNTGNSWANLADVTYVSTSIAGAKVSPVFTGIPVAPTASANTATTQIATTEFVATAISNLSGNVTGNFAPINSPSFTGIPLAPTPSESDGSTRVATTAFVQAQKVSPIFTGVPIAPTAVANTANTQIATTAFVQAQKASPAFTGIPTAPTAANATATTQIATTAFVQAQKDNIELTGIPVAPTANPADNSTQIATTAFVQAQKASPVFTGTPVAPTAAANTDTTQIATTAFVSAAISNLSGNVTGNFAPINSPIFTGTPLSPTPGSTDNSLRIATTAFVQAQKSSPIFTGVPTAPTPATPTSTTQIATTEFVQAQKDSPVFTGVPVAPTASASDNSSQLATTAFVQAQKSSPVFTGVPVAPTAVPSTSTTQIATTEFVQAQKSSPVFTGVPVAPTAVSGAANSQIATTAFVSTAVATATASLGSMSTQNANNVNITGGLIVNVPGLVPTGLIAMWSGSSASIPSGWALCNGSNGTPDLRNRFVVGAGGSYGVGATGGSADAILVSHTHTYGGSSSSGGQHYHGFGNENIGTNNGWFGYTTWSGQGFPDNNAVFWNGSGNYSPLIGAQTAGNLGTTGAIANPIGAGHNHNFSGTTSSQGSSGTGANLPPYYALCFIMKL